MCLFFGNVLHYSVSFFKGMYNNTKADRISFVLLNSKVDQCVVVGGGCARTLRALAAIVYMYKFKSKSVVFFFFFYEIDD